QTQVDVSLRDTPLKKSVTTKEPRRGWEGSANRAGAQDGLAGLQQGQDFRPGLTCRSRKRPRLLELRYRNTGVEPAAVLRSPAATSFAPSSAIRRSPRSSASADV